MKLDELAANLDTVVENYELEYVTMMVLMERCTQLKQEMNETAERANEALFDVRMAQLGGSGDVDLLTTTLEQAEDAAATAQQAFEEFYQQVVQTLDELKRTAMKVFLAENQLKRVGGVSSLSVERVQAIHERYHLPD